MPSIEIFNHKILINNKGENDNIIEKESGRQHRNQVIKFNIPSDEELHHVPPDIMHRGHNIIFVIVLPKMPNLNLNMRQYQATQTKNPSTN